MIKPKITTTLEEAVKLSENGRYKMIPIAAELFSDMHTPLNILSVLKKVSHHCFILESADNTKQWGRYTFLGYDPVMEISCINGSVTIKDGSVQTYENADPRKYIRDILESCKSPKLFYQSRDPWLRWSQKCIDGQGNRRGGLHHCRSRCPGADEPFRWQKSHHPTGF